MDVKFLWLQRTFQHFNTRGGDYPHFRFAETKRQSKSMRNVSTFLTQRAEPHHKVPLEIFYFLKYWFPNGLAGFYSRNAHDAHSISKIWYDRLYITVKRSVYLTSLQKDCWSKMNGCLIVSDSVKTLAVGTRRKWWICMECFLKPLLLTTRKGSSHVWHCAVFSNSKIKGNSYLICPCLI